MTAIDYDAELQLHHQFLQKAYGIQQTGTDIFVIEDDHLGPLGKPAPAVVGSTDRWAYIWSAAKALGPDLRVAVLAGDPSTVTRVEIRQQSGPGWVSHVLQRLVATILELSDTHNVLQTAEQAYQERRNTWTAALQAAEVQALGASGFNVWVPVPDETAVCVEPADWRIRVAAGGPFRIQTEQAIRITPPSTTNESSLDLVVATLRQVNRPEHKRSG